MKEKISDRSKYNHDKEVNEGEKTIKRTRVKTKEYERREALQSSMALISSSKGVYGVGKWQYAKQKPLHYKAVSLASRIKSTIFPSSFSLFVSTPDETSTPNGCTVVTASAMLAGLNPPARNSGRLCC